MKKVISTLTILSLLIGLCAGCGTNADKKKDYTGKEIAKLLLAEERLDSSKLQFDKEAEEFALFNNYDEAYTLLASNGGGIVPVGSFGGSSFQEECNMLSFFQSYTDAIQSQAEMAAVSIDEMKETIAYTDVWVYTGNGTNGKTMLTVEANMETLFNDCDESLFICRRYTDDNANDVYEILQYEKASGNEMYLYYCPGYWYEYAFRYKDQENADMFIVVENTRGYWNMFTTYWINDPTEVRTNTQNLISTGDATYVNFGEIYRSGYKFNNQTMISDAGRNCDLVTIFENGVEINVAAFSGIASVETDEDNFITSFTTTSGNTIVPETAKAFDENAQPEDMPDIYIHSGVAMNDTITRGTITVQFNIETTPRERVEKALAYMAELGITCKYDTSTILANANNAYELGNNFGSYYSWNGCPMSNLDNVEKAMEVDSQKHQVLLDAYEEIKDNKMIEMTSKGINYLGYEFAKVSLLTSSQVTFEDGMVKVSDMKMTIENLDVMDEGEEYTVHFALAKLDADSAQNNIQQTNAVQNSKITLVDLVRLGGSEDADYTGAVIMQASNEKMTTYESGTSFSLIQTAEFTLPQCTEEGVYTIVAYVATPDGIRVSEMVPVPFTSDVAYIGDNGDGLTVEMYLNDYQEVIAEYTSGIVAFVPVEVKESYTYAEVRELLCAEILKYGLVIDDAVVEIYDPETDTGSPTNENQIFTNEICRIKYSFKTTNAERYIYILLGGE